MNKHIERFAIEAGLDINSYDRYGSFDEEKFAQLIIRECADIFEGVYTDQCPGYRIDTTIKKHFGIE